MATECELRLPLGSAEQGRIERALFELRSGAAAKVELCSDRRWSSIAGDPQLAGAGTGGLFLGHFFLGTQKEVTRPEGRNRN
ncbi:MAG: hypothetical protein ACI89D_001792 [Bermanella sp.]|jgi:hypothetical protein